MALRSLREGFQEQDRRARRRRAVRQWQRVTRHKAMLRERERRLAYKKALQRQRLAERARKIDAAQRERVRRHRAMLRRREARLRAKHAR